MTNKIGAEVKSGVVLERKVHNIFKWAPGVGHQQVWERVELPPEQAEQIIKNIQSRQDHRLVPVDTSGAKNH